jgi:hypothetical protein
MRLKLMEISLLLSKVDDTDYNIQWINSAAGDPGQIQFNIAKSRFMLIGV